MRGRLRKTITGVGSMVAPVAVLLTGALAMAMVAPAAVLLAKPVAVLRAEPPEARAGSARRVEITVSRYAFEPARIEVQQGETVEVVVHSADTDHGFAIKALGVKVAVPKGGAPVEATFVAHQSGRFVIECSEYCGSGHKRMRGELVVTERAQ